VKMNKVIDFRQTTGGMTCKLTRYLELLVLIDKEKWNPIPIWPASNLWKENGKNLWSMLFQNYATTDYDTYEKTDLFDWYENYPEDKKIVRFQSRIKPFGWVQNLSPRDRKLAQSLIEKYIVPRNSIIKMIDEYQSDFFGNKKIIGVHCRGPGRQHGGVQKLRKHKKLKKDQVDYEDYFSLIDNHIQEYDKIFLTTDADVVRDVFFKRYNNKIIFINHELPKLGEAHEVASAKKNIPSAEKMFTECLIDMYLLSRCDRLICGNSNVSLYVQCINSNLPTEFIYNY
jgi:hypothetical protein